MIFGDFEDPGGIKHAPCPTVWSPRKAPLWSPASRRGFSAEHTGEILEMMNLMDDSLKS
jgi:hypothetical protein